MKVIQIDNRRIKKTLSRKRRLATMDPLPNGLALLFWGHHRRVVWLRRQQAARLARYLDRPSWVGVSACDNPPSHPECNQWPQAQEGVMHPENRESVEAQALGDKPVIDLIRGVIHYNLTCIR